jgi:predicted RNA-binding protein with PUA domain
MIRNQKMYFCKECNKIVNDEICFICKSKADEVDLTITKGDDQWQQQTYVQSKMS